ncbi:hypothetical protein HYH03_005887 [Edaphochlamys debaryana]|uniref:GATA-type domain-containing protein n=1 Tax=Edaphochlamys debaryana TaxID=47281 RepID=A0A836C1J7_9CHLO|nr:hypothetical protein HYH03_005887 [Edaphochlamys debaryana]|eukprot:KAG2495957.1 hypothetical protein HYH03_005887 [Edaphochlamys debaryana]
MAPAPAFESSSVLSAFFSASAAPLVERVCNGANSWAAGCSTKPVCAQRSASFLDAEDCLTCSSRACFLIPEDSYLPGQENVQAATACPHQRAASCPCALSNGLAATQPLLGALPEPLAPACPAFTVLSGEDEFVAASVCFEKAVQALEMVDLPAPQPAPPRRSDISGGGCCAAGAASVAGSTCPSPLEQPSAPARCGSPLEPSPAASGNASDQGSGDAAADSDPASASDGTSARAGAGAVDSAAVLAGQAWAYAAAVQAAEQAQAEEGAAEVAEAAPAAPAPRAFHHKTGGPCDHCGATESPQWRRGPAHRPTLCNACGTRFRRTGQLNPANMAPGPRTAAPPPPPVLLGKRVSKPTAAAAKRGRGYY